MKKIILSFFVFLGIMSTCSAQEFVDKTMDYKKISPTAFSAQLKNSKSYNAPSYNLHSSDYSGSMEGMMMNAMMSGMMNAMTMGVVDNCYSADMMKKQQEEYARQQAKYMQEMDDEPEEKSTKEVNAVKRVNAKQYNYDDDSNQGW